MKKILAVDDEPDICFLVQVLLEQEGYQVRTAVNGARALEMAAADCPDLIILDIMMPGMSGLEVLLRLRADTSTKDVPVIVLTARQGALDVTDSLSLGADVHLSKPFSPDDLLSLVSRLAPLQR